MGWVKVKNGEYESDGASYFYNGGLKPGHALILSDVIGAPIIGAMRKHGKDFITRSYGELGIALAQGLMVTEARDHGFFKEVA